MDPIASLEPIEENAPCGPDLEYDPDFLKMETAASGTQDHAIGDSVIKGEAPDWKGALRLARELLKRTYDLRVAVIHAQALIAIEGYPGFAQGVSLILQLLNSFWDTLHPELDPAEGNDPIMRANVLSALNDRRTTIAQIRNANLIESRIFGNWSLNQIGMARGEVEVPAGMDRPDIAAFDAAIREADKEGLIATINAVETAITAVEQIRDFFSQHGGLVVDDLRRELKQALHYLSPALDSDDHEKDASDEDDEEEDEGSNAKSGGKKEAFSGKITNRTDVLRALDEICAYYKRSEPSSPVPLLLGRARRLVDLDFYSIIKDLAPDGESQVLNISGRPPDEGDNETDTF